MQIILAINAAQIGLTYANTGLAPYKVLFGFPIPIYFN